MSLTQVRPHPCSMRLQSATWHLPLFYSPTITKTMFNQEWAMGIEEMIESEAQAQALCMLTQDFKRAFDAFAAKQQPKFEGN